MNIIEAKRLFGLFNQEFSLEELKKVYREESKKYHPDLNPGKDTLEKMKDVNLAFEILKKYINEKSENYTFSDYKNEKIDELIDFVENLNEINLNNYNFKVKDLYMKVSYHEKVTYDKYIYILETCRTRQEFDFEYKNFNIEINNLICSFIDDLFKIFEIYLNGFNHYEKILELYNVLREECKDSLTVSEAFLKFEEATNKLYLEEERLNEESLNKLKKLIEASIEKYKTNSNYSTLTKQINAIVKKYTITYEDDEAMLKSIKLMEKEIEKLFENYSKFIAHKKEKINYISKLISECLFNDSNVQNIVKQYANKLEAISNLSEFDSACKKIEDKFSSKKNEIEISSVVETLLFNFQNSNTKDVKSLAKNSLNLHIALNYISNLTNNIDKMKLYYLKQLKFKNQENDERIINYIQNKVDYIPLPLEVIPDISKERLLKLYEKIKPIVSEEDRHFIIREFVLDEIEKNLYESTKLEEINFSDYECIGKFNCFHQLGVKGYFKPTIKEVLSQIPINLIKSSQAFEIVSAPKIVRDIDLREEAAPSYFKTSVNLYKRK